MVCLKAIQWSLQPVERVAIITVEDDAGGDEKGGDDVQKDSNEDTSKKGWIETYITDPLTNAKDAVVETVTDLVDGISKIFEVGTGKEKQKAYVNGEVNTQEDVNRLEERQKRGSAGVEATVNGASLITNVTNPKDAAGTLASNVIQEPVSRATDPPKNP
jgi:hypothetical protein